MEMAVSMGALFGKLACVALVKFGLGLSLEASMLVVILVNLAWLVGQTSGVQE